MRASRMLLIATALTALAACSSCQPSGTTTSIETIDIQDSFISCVSPTLKVRPIGASQCPDGDHEGGVCHLLNGTAEFVEDTEAAVDSCKQRGGTLEAG